MNTQITSCFDAIDLSGLDQVKLMERTDKKFVVPAEKIPEILNEISNDYYILEIDNRRILQYNTHYFDTRDDKLYTYHHNGKLNRYKVRKRTYVDTQISFLEVKFKNNKGKTFKQRIQSHDIGLKLNEAEKSFLEGVFPINPAELQPKSTNKFRRITLADKKLTERCTIDFDFEFISDDKTVFYDDFAIIELKQDKYSNSSRIYQCLFNHRIRPTGFSKYCIGRVLAEEDIKKNLFKQKMRMLNKIIQN
ncbi:polyphosphate polymerase domain-containing protein [Sunxiuqinia sp. A32]|uniref:polyphosphate polymerase domain-containing protein n=1 Tax=Sunxiuqinia sp. A32 TaxID=3461496 RepID=UPI0040462176